MRYILVMIYIVVLMSTASANDLWFPVVISSATDPQSVDGGSNQLTYRALSKADKKWKICVSFPHLKDDYWLAVNYGIAQEIRRLGVEMELFEAGGYENLDNQIKQIEKCVDQGAQAVIIASIDNDALNPLVAKLKQKNIVVIDLVNGMSSRLSDARSLVSFYQMGQYAGEYLVTLRSKKRRPITVAWFPGPENAAWVVAGNKGFRDAINGYSITIESVMYGDVGRAAQGELIKEALTEHPDVDVIVGTSATVLAAIPIIRSMTKHKPDLVSYYMTRGVYNAIVRKRVLAAPTDQAVLQGRIAVDQAVRVLQNDEYLRHAGPIIKVIDQKNIHQYDVNTILAPNGFTAELSIK